MCQFPVSVTKVSAVLSGARAALVSPIFCHCGHSDIPVVNIPPHFFTVLYRDAGHIILMADDET